MIHRISVRTIGRWSPWLLAGIAAYALPLGHAPQAQAATSTATCPGHSLLTCSERSALYDDSVTWTFAYVRDAEPFETAIPVGLRNRALSEFWRFEMASAAARAMTEDEIGNQDVDPNFEATVARPTLPAPSVTPAGVVSRSLAHPLAALMLAEQQEVLNLEAMATALDRATAAQIERSRPDWVAWQQGVAAGYAIHAAAAIGRVERRERTVARLFKQRRMLFGVGSVDLRLAQRAVRRHHAFVPSLVSEMRYLGMSSILIAYATEGFTRGNFGSESFSLTDTLAAPAALSSESGLARQLRQFAAATPRATRPS